MNTITVNRVRHGIDGDESNILVEIVGLNLVSQTYSRASTARRAAKRLSSMYERFGINVAVIDNTTKKR